MAWNLKAHLDDAVDQSVETRSAYRAGYSDGYYRYTPFTSNERDYYPQSYMSGYTQGQADASAANTEEE